jgi:hypothetical protein
MANGQDSRLDYSFIAYVFICIVIGIGLFRVLSNSGRTWSAMVVLILSILIFVFYGLRWFTDTGQSKFSYNGPWPPIINMCPDYLVYFKNGNLDTCVDMLGISKNGGLKPWTKEDNPRNPPQDQEKYFPNVYKPGMSETELTTLCNETIRAGLTWEGITNGESCTFKPY